ncbi:MAG: type II 3-dehydroquinate dehydratase [Sphingobacteriia bacterium]|nr:type II 3-dehydroquinate dehydratase [Sphingobacteriia bacterium]
MSAKVLIINGPNLNMLGTRNPEVYGFNTIFDIEQNCHDFGSVHNLIIDFRQSNNEGEIIEWIQESEKFDALIINAAGFTHTSIAILDALLMLTKPIIEVHITNIYKREKFRRKSLVSRAATGVISGFGANSYILALHAVLELVE